MDKQIVKRIILERQQEVRERVLVVRPIPFEDKKNYVLVGIRRAGKSCLMVQDMQQRINNKSMKVEDFLYINFEDERIRYMQASELGVILDCYAEMFGDKKPFIYLDEVHVIDGWEQFVRRLADQQYRVMVTGSNAKMLSSEVATTLGGRFIIREVWPFSFSEYLLYHQTELHNNWMFDPNILRNIARQMDSYLADGGFAETFNLIDKREWVNSLYQKILMGDIVARNNIRNVRSIRLLAKKLAECVTQPVSLTRLQNIVRSTGEKVSLTSVKDYLQYFEDSYMTFALTNFVSPFTEQETIKKRYFSDNKQLSVQWGRETIGKLMRHSPAKEIQQYRRATRVLLQPQCGSGLLYSRGRYGSPGIDKHQRQPHHRERNQSTSRPAWHPPIEKGRHCDPRPRKHHPNPWHQY